MKLGCTRVEFPFTENSFNQLISLRSSVMFLETFIMLREISISDLLLFDMYHFRFQIMLYLNDFFYLSNLNTLALLKLLILCCNVIHTSKFISLQIIDESPSFHRNPLRTTIRLFRVYRQSYIGIRGVSILYSEDFFCFK